MINITLQVIIDPPTHNISDRPLTEAARSRPGDIVSVYFTENVGPMNPSLPLGFIHITGAPDVPLQRLINKVCGPLLEADEITRKHAWRVPPSVLPLALRNKLVADREITVTWTQAKTRIRKKIAATRLNPVSDDETTELTDGDLA